MACRILKHNSYIHTRLPDCVIYVWLRCYRANTIWARQEWCFCDEMRVYPERRCPGNVQRCLCGGRFGYCVRMVLAFPDLGRPQPRQASKLVDICSRYSKHPQSHLRLRAVSIYVWWCGFIISGWSAPSIASRTISEMRPQKCPSFSLVVTPHRAAQCVAHAAHVLHFAFIQRAKMTL